MNAKERKRLIGAIETYLPLEYREPILRALRLLAAAEANDGSTPETDDAWTIGYASDNFGEAINQAAAALINREQTSSRLERERNALAARVCELEPDAERLEWIEGHLFDKAWNGVIDSGSRTHWRITTGYRHITANMEGATFRAAIDTARGSK